MARKEKNSADYFPHKIGSGKKMFVIERKFGNDGYATWFKILEVLTVTEYHFIDLSHEDQIIFLAAKCNVDEDLLIKIINELAKIGAVNQFLWDKKIVWSDYFIENIADAYIRRNNKCIQFEDLCIRLGINCIRYVGGNEENVYINPHTKLKYTILNNTKVDYTNNSSLKNDGDSDFKNPQKEILFEDFWNIYKKKTGRLLAEQKWNKLKHEEKEIVMKHVPKYVNKTPDIKFRKDASTYLNQKTFLDEIENDTTSEPQTSNLTIQSDGRVIVPKG